MRTLTKFAARGLAGAVLLVGPSCGGEELAAPTRRKYEAYCLPCHETGAAAAPRTGDERAWSLHVVKSMPQLVASVRVGSVAMPPSGGCASCDDPELEAIIRFMSGYDDHARRTP